MLAEYVVRGVAGTAIACKDVTVAAKACTGLTVPNAE